MIIPKISRLVIPILYYVLFFNSFHCMYHAYFPIGVSLCIFRLNCHTIVYNYTRSRIPIIYVVSCVLEIKSTGKLDYSDPLTGFSDTLIVIGIR